MPLGLTRPAALAAEGVLPSEVEWAFLPLSACRHAVRTLSFPIQVRVGIWLVVSEDSSGIKLGCAGSEERRSGSPSLRLPISLNTTLPISDSYGLPMYVIHGFVAVNLVLTVCSGILPDTRYLGRYLISCLIKFHLPLTFPADYLHPSHCHANRLLRHG